MSIKIEGLNELIRDFDTAASTIGKRADEEIGEAAEKVAAAAGLDAPRGPTGDLAASYEAERVEELHWQVGSPLRYARFVEFGTYKDSPQPHLFPAADRLAGDFYAGILRVGGDI